MWRSSPHPPHSPALGLSPDPACLGLVPGLRPYLQTCLATGVCLTPCCHMLPPLALPFAPGMPMEQVQA